MIQDTCFRPKPDWVGDVIPWTDQEEIRLYYLLERRRLPKPGTPWSLVVTNDLVHYEDCGEALPSGGVDAEDFNAYTGSIVQSDDGMFHLFYTASNPDRLAADGRPLQLVAHATSVDMKRWVKHPEDTFGAPSGTRRCTALQGTLVGPSFSRRGIRRVPTGAEGSWRG